MDEPNKNLILPVGTRVVTRVEVKSHDGRPVRARGAVGIVINAPMDHFHTYRVRFPDGGEAFLKRHEVTVFSRYQAEARGENEHVLGDYNLFDHVIYRCVVGSRAYGLARDDSDLDRRGIYLPPAELHWSLYGVPGQLEQPETDEVYWELQKFLLLALKANPNVLECLYTPLVEYAHPLAEELRALRGCFLSRLAYQTFNGYVLSQFKKMEQDLRNKGQIRWKHAMHLIRLLGAGTVMLREGRLPVDAGTAKDELVAIRDGAMAWDEVERLRLSLHREFERAYAETALPERPDYAKANAFLVRARRQMALEGGNEE